MIKSYNQLRIHGIHLIIAMFVIGLFQALPASSQNMAINEIMASNKSTIQDMDGDFSDWIELYNHGEDSVDLEGWGLSDTPEDPYRWTFPARMIKPGEYLLVWASGKDRRPDATSMTNGLMREVYAGISGTKIVNLTNHASYPGNPTSAGIISGLFESPTDVGDDYGQRMHGWIRAPQTGLYTFWIAGDDECHLYLGSGESPDDVTLIARVPEWTFPRQWHKYPEQQSAEIYLHEGVLYYVKALMKEAGGGDCLAVGWKLPDEHQEMPIEGEHIFWHDSQLHANFAINASGEEVLLTSPSGDLADLVSAQTIPADISYGRYPDGTGEMVFFSEATPGRANHSDIFHEVLAPPAFSHAAGFHPGPFNLVFQHDDPDVKIIYTLDGSIPDSNNLEGSTFGYKNRYPQAPNSSPGSMRYSTFKSILFEDTVAMTDRTQEPETLARMSSTFHTQPTYFPEERIFKGHVVRAMAVKEGAIPSPVITRSYFINPRLNDRYSLPIISVSLQPDNLFGYERGIYVAGRIFDNWRASNPSTGVTGGSNANYHQLGKDWEYPAHLEFFEKNAPKPTLSQDIGLRIHGGWTRALPMKSLRLYARSEYGESRFNHRLFPDQPYDSFNRIILRNGGNDFPNTMFRDAAIQAMVAHLNMDVLAYRPVVVFMNGEYWGIHNLRERYDKHYLNRVYGVDPENIDLLNYAHGLGIAIREGDRTQYDSMTAYINANGLTNDQHYRHIQTMIDTENFIDYNISHIFVYNHDWPGNNTELWRLRKSSPLPDAPAGHDGRWRWLLFDTDYGLGWWDNNVNHNTLAFATQAGRTGWPNPDFSTFLLRSLLKNQSFRNDFINRFADLLNTAFLPERTTGIVAAMKAAIEPEMAEHIARWSMPASMDKWGEEVQVMSDFLMKRPAIQRKHIRQHFGLGGYTRISLDVSSPDQGYIKLNTIDILSDTEGIGADPYPWSGIYYQGIPIHFEAHTLPGYTFDRWEGLDEVLAPKTQQVFTDSIASVKAHFAEAEALHYWHFNDLQEGPFSGIEPDLSLQAGGLITYQGTGEGYMDMVADGSSTNALTDVADGVALRLRNPSDTREMIIQAPTTGYRSITLSYASKRTNNGAMVQKLAVRTSANSPWQPISSSVPISDEWTLHHFSLPSDDVNNNPELVIRVSFHGEHVSGNSGNNRFDNIRVEGLAIKPDDGQVSAKPISGNAEKMSCWHYQGTLNLVSPFAEASSLTIFNMSGHTLTTYPVPGPGHHTFPFAGGPGIYIIQLLGRAGIATARIMVR